MAKRSDFAQKLLDDLRLRKERMAASPSHRSNQSNHLPIDAYAYTKQTYRGSRNTKSNEIVSSRSGEMLNRWSSSSSSRRHRSVTNGELSNQIIPYGKGQSQSLGNMSQALAFAFENGGGKLRRADFSIMGFLHQIKSGSNLDRQLASSSHYPIPPALSLVQINEISKGAQKLNHILRACSKSNGLNNMDPYSLQFAKELLQGAIDLEASLRMLVDLQKRSSEFMITPQAQNKNRIRLLELEEDNDIDIDEEEEEEDERRMEQMQVARPTFSFDKMQRPIKEARKMKVSEKRNATTSSSEWKNQTASNSCKARIPNVIAKLMGLDNLPEKKVGMESKHMLMKKDSGGSNTQKIDLTSFKHTAKGTSFTTTLKNKEADNLMKNKQKVVLGGGGGAFKMPSTQTQTQDEDEFGAHKNLILQKAITSDFDKASIKKGSAQKNHTRESQNYAHVMMMGRKQDRHPNNSKREQKGTVNGRTIDRVLNNTPEQVHERSQVKSSSIQVEKEINASIVQPERRHTITNKHILSNEKNKSPNHLGGVQKSSSLKNGPLEQKQQLQLMVRPQGGSEMTMTPKNLPHQSINNPQKKQPSINQPTPLRTNQDLVRDEASNEEVKEMINRKSGQISSPRYQEFERPKGRHGIETHKLMKDEKHVHKLAGKKIKNTMRNKVGQMLTGRSEQGKQQIHGLQEADDKASGKFNVLNGAEQERFIIEAGAPINIIISSIEPHKEADLPPTLYSSGGGKFQSRQESAIDLHYQDVQSEAAINLQDQAAPREVDEGFKTGKVALRKTNGIQEDGMGVNHSKLQDQNISEINIQQPLTESENCLKWILVMSQLFVNTAEALFRLNIPFSVLQGGRQDNQDQGSKLILDCGYEVMKRKGIRQELKVHNRSKLSISSTVNIIRSLDDLVRQLNEDMEKLKFYGREKSTQVDVEDYLPKMLEHDVCDKYPDIDCMWDFGWNDETFAFIEKYDVIRDTEKHILSVLLDEITKDCCMFNEDLI